MLAIEKKTVKDVKQDPNVSNFFNFYIQAFFKLSVANQSPNDLGNYDQALDVVCLSAMTFRRYKPLQQRLFMCISF